MKLTPVQIDVAIAVVAAIVIIVVAPGLAITALVALLILLLCGITLLFDRWRQRRPTPRARRGRRREPPVRRMPPGRI